MAPNKSLDENNIIAAALRDVCNVHGVVFNHTSRRNTLNKVSKRLASEGIGFLTKTLPKLGKAFDKALSGGAPLNSVDLRFEPQDDSKLPRFLGELFNRVLDPSGRLLPDPCTNSVRSIREICYLFYKYELPYTDEQEQQVINRFVKTEDELSTVHESLKELQTLVDNTIQFANRRRVSYPTKQIDIVRNARRLLWELFKHFDPYDIFPRHGPGAVATKQQLGAKYLWQNVSGRITKHYPLDTYFYVNAGHVCDDLEGFKAIQDADLPARVILVPKDSRGPRLISCEPVDFQWVQQGLSKAIVELVENHVLTKYSVFFTDQLPNQFGAQLGSKTGRYATLDLNEASDRVSVDLVRLLFPGHIYDCLEACRSSSTELPSGQVLKLRKFAPMGSSLCFPIMALTIWAILAAAAPDADTRECIHVYGDDVIVRTAYAADAIKHLESFGLKINQDKSCTGGLFRESCGMDAFKGVSVTPVRLRTVWATSPSPDVYTSWIAYANSFFSRHYYETYDLIVGELERIYGPIPAKDMNLSCPSLELVTSKRLPRRRVNKELQTLQYLVWTVKSPTVSMALPGWSMLLRYFAEVANDRNRKDSQEFNPLQPDRPVVRWNSSSYEPELPFSVGSYTRRRTSMLVRRWR